MQDISKIVDNLEVKIQNLVERYDFLRAENDLMRGQLSQIQQELNAKTRLIKENEDQLLSLKVAKTIQGSENSKETTQKINTLVKEIDWCIAQLSD
jgi:cell fate (sporulation/competence/biofilm development) regulator YmcA (YheA/YmcA/DUF963 family)